MFLEVLEVVCKKSKEIKSRKTNVYVCMNMCIIYVNVKICIYVYVSACLYIDEYN